MEVYLKCELVCILEILYENFGFIEKQESFFSIPQFWSLWTKGRGFSGLQNTNVFSLKSKL